VASRHDGWRKIAITLTIPSHVYFCFRHGGTHSWKPESESFFQEHSYPHSPAARGLDYYAGFRLSPVIGEKSRSPTMSAVSSTLSSTPQHALGEERYFALVDGLRVSNLGSL
jgi:hypothetical protein